MAFNGILKGTFGYWLLRKLVTDPPGLQESTADAVEPDWEVKLKHTFGCDFASSIKDKVVLDYGCGYGQAVLCMAKMGARRVIGLDINEQALNYGRDRAIDAHVHSECVFLNAKYHGNLQALNGEVDVIISHDAFEHYSDPKNELSVMWKLLRRGGSLFISFGPPWWHPYGCHLMFMEAPPWTHVFFNEQTIMAVRKLYRSDGAKRFENVEGGLNKMTIRRFEQLVRNSGFSVHSTRYVPIRGTRLLAATRFGREFFTSVVRAHLVKHPV
jgi:SAM-dependent methyltransferase